MRREASEIGVTAIDSHPGRIKGSLAQPGDQGTRLPVASRSHDHHQGALKSAIEPGIDLRPAHPRPAQRRLFDLRAIDNNWRRQAIDDAHGVFHPSGVTPAPS
ncbi:MAG: hypothetical protein U0075_26390 [Thermomicrobiales bacterium]